MNRNVESHFSQLPSADIPRSRFDRSQDIKFTFDCGQIVPFFCEEVLPGDSFDITTSKVVRLQTLLTPVMDNMYLDTYFFYVKMQDVWKHTKQFFGESEKAWTPEVEYTIPTLRFFDVVEGSGDGAVQTGDILDYLGVPVGVSGSSALDYLDVNALPYRCYRKIYDDWFRDENLIDPLNLDDGDNYKAYASLSSSDRKPFIAAKFHDYFTSGLPSPAKIATPVSAPVKNSDYTKSTYNPWVYTAPTTRSPSGQAMIGNYHYGDDNYITKFVSTNVPSSTDPFNVMQTPSFVNANGWEPTNLYTQIQNSSLGVFITDLRYAVAVQQFYETLGRSGSRYCEIISSMFGVHAPDLELGRSEYLGGNRIPISIHQITNQSQGENAFLGDLGAMSLTTDKHSDFVKSFSQHGYIIGVCVARYDHSYPQGLERFWFRRSKFDFFWPVFQNLSEQRVYKGEIYWSPDKDSDGNYIANQTFAYQERYAEYRFKPNRVAGEMRPGISNTLDSWHFADYYTQSPTFSKEWIQEDKTNVDRTLAVTSDVSNQIFCDIYVQNFATRPMPVFGIPGLYRM